MGHPAGFFHVEERLAGLSKKGDDLDGSPPSSTSSCSGPSSRGRSEAITPQWAARLRGDRSDRALDHPGYSNPKVDELMETIGKTIVPYARDGMIEEVWKIVLDDMVYVPLHRQVVIWAMRDNLHLPVNPYNRPQFREARLMQPDKWGLVLETNDAFLARPPATASGHSGDSALRPYGRLRRPG